MAIRIVADSASDFTPEECRQRNVTCVPMTVAFGSQSYQDGVELTKEAFFERLKKEYPKTSQPAPAAFLEAFQAAKEAGDTVIAILVSGALSGTCQSASLAKELAEYPDIHIVDSKTATLGLRLLVDRAVELRDSGAGAQEIVDALEALKSRIRIFAGLDTLTYLAKGGRLPKSAAGIGNLVDLKPIIAISQQGTVELIGKQFGLRRAYRLLGDAVAKEPPDTAYPVYFIYADSPQNSDGLARAIHERGLAEEPTEFYGIGATIGSHIGPGAFGIVYVRQ